MANQVSLMAYLQHGFQSPPVIDQGQSAQNTRNDRYSAEDITSVGRWASFNLASIQQQFGTILAAGCIAGEPVSSSPLRPVNSEAAIRSLIDNYITNRIIRALRYGFTHIMASQQPTRLTTLHYGPGTLAMTVDNYVPDTAFFDPTLPAQTRPNRVPGDIKPSYKWSLDRGNSPNPRQRTEFKQALSQVNFYMKQHHTRYSFSLTDREFVAVRRLDRDGNLELSDSIPWNATGTDASPCLTVLLGLWYLGMLAAHGQDWVLD